MKLKIVKFLIALLVRKLKILLRLIELLVIHSNTTNHLTVSQLISNVEKN